VQPGTPHARGERDTVDHAPNGHDDLANSAAGALLLAHDGRRLSLTVMPVSIGVGPSSFALGTYGHH